jgi:hypothetical protein
MPAFDYSIMGICGTVANYVMRGRALPDQVDPEGDPDAER